MSISTNIIKINLLLIDSIQLYQLISTKYFQVNRKYQIFLFFLFSQRNKHDNKKKLKLTKNLLTPLNFDSLNEKGEGKEKFSFILLFNLP